MKRAPTILCLAMAILFGLSGPSFWRGAGALHAASASQLSDDLGHGHSHDHDSESGQQHLPHGSDHSHVTLGLTLPLAYAFVPIASREKPAERTAQPKSVVVLLERPPRRSAAI